METRRTRTTYCPPGYTLGYTPSRRQEPRQADDTTKVAFLISKEIEPGAWAFRQYGGNVAAVDIETIGWAVTIINVYNLGGSQARLTTWPDIARAIAGAKEDFILLGDFNAHHPRWGGIGTRNDPQAEHLWEKVETYQLHMLTEQGRPTWERNGAKSVIDLTFGTKGVYEKLT
jgi:hypothetical protein